MKLTINRLMPNGGVNAITEYDEADWCILTFPSRLAAEQFARTNNMEFGYTPEVSLQLEASNEQKE